METKAGINLFTKQGITSPCVSYSIILHNLPKDDSNRYWYLPEAGHKAKGGLPQEVSPTADNQSKKFKVYDAKGQVNPNTETWQFGQ